MKVISCIALLFIVVFFSCNEAIGPNTNIVFPEEGKGEVSFFSHVQPLLKVKCATANCHSAEYAAGQRILTEYTFLFTGKNLGLIILGKPDESLLIQVMDGRNPHLDNIRLGTGIITQNQLQGMRRWILDGAPNN